MLVALAIFSLAALALLRLGGATAALCLAETGANPVRPHMLFFNSGHTHGVLAFVASGHVVIFDGGYGTMLFAAGLLNGACPELWNDTHAAIVAPTTTSEPASTACQRRLNAPVTSSIQAKPSTIIGSF